MGDPSDIVYVPIPASTTPINWTRIPEASKFLLKYYGYDWENEVVGPLPATVADLAKMFDGTKFFGYFRPDLCTLLMDISEFGLQATPGPQVQAGPRFYMKYLEQVWFLLFTPGNRDCISGNSDDIVRRTDDEIEGDADAEDDRFDAEKLIMAQAFDAKLEREVSRGAAVMVDFNNKLGGWNATMLQDSLQDAESIMTLLRSHGALLQSV